MACWFYPVAKAVSKSEANMAPNPPPILNLGLFRPIFSPTDFIQIKGRGTRKHDFRELLFDETIKEEAIGFDGMKIDRMFYQKFEDTIPLSAEVVVPIRGDLFFQHDQTAGRLEVGSGLAAAEGLEVGGEFGLDLREVVFVGGAALGTEAEAIVLDFEE